MIDGLVKVPTSKCKDAIEYYECVKECNDHIMYNAREKAISDIELSWWDRLWSITKRGKFADKVYGNPLRFWSREEWLEHYNYITKEDYKEYKHLERYENIMQSVKSLCKMNQEHVYLSPQQAEFVWEYGNVEEND